jgi:hypothetical protein
MPKRPDAPKEDPVEGSRKVIDRELERSEKKDEKPRKSGRGDPGSLEHEEEGGGPA